VQALNFLIEYYLRNEQVLELCKENLYQSPLETAGFPVRGKKRPLRKESNLFRYYKLTRSDICRSMKHSRIDLGLFRDNFTNW